jgi:PAS domain S-box-containing protein
MPPPTPAAITPALAARAPSPSLSPAVVSRLDRLLHPSRLAAGREELRRARVLAGTAALLLAAAYPAIGVTLLERPPAAVVAMLLAGLACYHAAPALLRYSAVALSVPAVVACAPILASFAFLALHHGGSGYVANPWNIAVGLFVTYFVGARAGLALSALLGVELVAAVALDRLGLARAAMPPATGWSGVVADVLGLVAIGAIGSLYALSREAAHRDLDEALTRVAGSEARVVTLVENTDDLIASFDADGRLVVANTAFREAARPRLGRPPVEGDEIDALLTGETAHRWRERIARTLGGEQVAVEESYATDGGGVHMEFRLSPIPRPGGGFAGFTLFARDITARKAAEAALRAMHQQLVDLSRQAGMAEVATGILHNVGNTLNSVNVAASLAVERLQRSRVPNLARVAAMLREHGDDLGAFVTDDPKGRLVPGYVAQLADALVAERDELQADLAGLLGNVDHIKSVVRLQQEHAAGGDFVEVVPVGELVAGALRLHDESFSRLGIELTTDCPDAPPLTIDRHKVLQILVNLLGNARHALIDSERPDKRLAIVVDLPTPERVRIRVIDNGVGIAPEDKARLFRQGFTTRRDGHGFGLHMSALNAASIGGTLACESDGRGRGATFTLEVPVRAG